MAYSFHIERLPTSNLAPISLDEWKQAVTTIEGVRLCSAREHRFTNPKTNAVITIPVREGDAEVRIPSKNKWIPFFSWHKWIPVFSWHDGSATFAWRFGAIDVTDPVWLAAVALAKRLNATIQGDEGELYDFETGEQQLD